MTTMPASWRNWIWPQSASEWRNSCGRGKAQRDRLWATVCPDCGRGRVPAPLGGFQASVGRLWEALRYKASGPFGAEPKDERESRRKPWRFCAPDSHIRPAVRAVSGDGG